MTDPTHPLYGRRFRVLSISHPAQRPGHVIVAYRDTMRIRIPVTATSLAPDHVPPLRTKLSRDALRDLLALLPEGAVPCPEARAISGADSPTP